MAAVLFLKTHVQGYTRSDGVTLTVCGCELAKADGWTPPTPEQAAAGNYKKPRVRWQGLEIAIENPAGSVREGKGWRTKMKYDYGYVCRSEAVDGDEVDVYLGPELDTAPMVYVVHQRKYGDWESYDEDKCMLGFASETAAREAYLKHYDDPRFLGPITAMPVDEFVRKVRATYDKPAMIKSTNGNERRVLFFRLEAKDAADKIFASYCNLGLSSSERVLFNAQVFKELASTLDARDGAKIRNGTAQELG
jgi:hypothetical protein